MSNALKFTFKGFIKFSIKKIGLLDGENSEGLVDFSNMDFIHDN